MSDLRVIVVQTQPVYGDGSKGEVMTRVFFDDEEGRKAADAEMTVTNPFDDDPPPPAVVREMGTYGVEGLPETWWMVKLRGYAFSLENEARRLLERDYQAFDDYQRGRIDGERKYKKKIAEELRALFDLPAASEPPPPPPAPGIRPLTELEQKRVELERAGAPWLLETHAKLDELLKYARAGEERRAPAPRINVNTPHGDLATRVWASEGFEPGIFEHYKGGKYTAIAVAEMHESRWPFVVYYSHEKRTLNLRPLKPIAGEEQTVARRAAAAADYEDAWLEPAVPNLGGYEVERFKPVHGTPVLNLVHLVNELG